MAAPPAYPTSHGEALMMKFRDLAQKHEISDFFAQKLKQLEGWEVVLILDDSGSMGTPLQQQSGSPFGQSKTRWDELKHTASIVVDIASVMDKDGLDIYFLNRATLLNVSDSSQLAPVFAHPPAGMTPISPVVQAVLQAKKQVSKEKKVLILIATDGAPTNPQGDVDIATLKHILISERDPSRFYVTFLACTDDLATVSYLNEWDRVIPNLDVVDDYVSERQEILKAQGPKFQFSFGNYIVKALLGAIDPSFDKLDESTKACCTIL